jgi:hypothetical protein
LNDFNGSNSPDNDTRAAMKRAARDKAGEGAGLVADKAADVTDTAKDRASDVAGEAAARARDVAGELRDQVHGQAQTQTDRAARNIKQFSDDLRAMGESGDENSPAARAVTQLADHGHHVADRLGERGPQGLLEDVQDFARRRPGAFLAGAALAGFAAARLGKGIKSAGGPGADPTDRGADRTSRPPREAPGHPTTTAAADGAGAAEPADPYTGPVTAPGPLRVTDRLPDPDAQQSQGS